MIDLTRVSFIVALLCAALYVLAPLPAVECDAIAAPINTYQCQWDKGCKATDRATGVVVTYRRGDMVTRESYDGITPQNGWKKVDTDPAPMPKPEPRVVKSWWRRLLGL